MPTLKTRVIKKSTGEVVVVTTSTFSKDEAENLVRIADDPNVDWPVLRSKESDVIFSYLRIIHFWADVWNNRQTHSKMITESVMRKADTVKRLANRKKKRKRR